MPIANKRTAEVSVSPIRRGATQAATILVVDDIESNRDFLVTLLRHHGHRLVEATDGKEGLAVVRAEHPDLVITDVLMPVMDGYEFVRQLRLDPETSRIPVVFYTAHYGEREATALALESGVSHVLTKPVKSAEVLEVVDRLLSAPSPVELLPELAPLPTDFDRQHLRLLTDKLSQKVGDLITSNSRLRALINIEVELASEADSGRRLLTVCEAAMDLFGATYVTIGILNRNRRTIHQIHSCGSDSADWIAPGEPVSGILGRAIDERRTFRGNNPGGDPARLGLPSTHPRIQAFLTGPIGSSDSVYGWICLVGNEGRAFTEDDEHLLSVLTGQVGRIYDLEFEIIDRKQAELALPRSEERARFALESAGVGVWDMDYASGVHTWSETLEAQYGLMPGTFTGTFEAFVALVHPDDREELLETVGRAMRTGDDFSYRNRAVWPNGTIRWLTGAGRVHLGENGQPVRAVGISLDVTDHRKLEEQYQQAQKMEAIGRLAGGVAHDFNNLLTVILGHCELMLSSRHPGDPDQESLAEIQKAGASAAGLTRQLLAFSRKQIIEPTLLDLNGVVSNLQGMLGRLIGEDVTVVYSLSPEPAFVKADRGQMEQIVVNLAVNARDAMPNGGTLTIQTSLIELDEHYASTHAAVTPGSYVGLILSDTGTGMTPEVQSRLFEPFFTTKDVGKGTGLGLATVHGIVTANGGSVTVYSEVGHGTSFNVYFPKADASDIPAGVAEPLARSTRGPETILVVEDARGLRDLTRKLLARLGYTVLTAANADEALSEFARHPDIDLLLTDVVMPGASGPDLTRQLVEQQPSLRVIYMSGYTEDAIVHHGVINQGIAFLHKPFSSEALGRKVREVLDR